MKTKHYEKIFEVNGVRLKLKKLGLSEFPSFKTLYATAIESKDFEGANKAHNILYSWLLYEVLPDEWVPVYNAKEDVFVVDALNDVVTADKIINILLAEVLAPLFLNTAESMK